MIRVTIEMVPLGIDGLKRHMATIEIANDVGETVETKGRRGSYVARFQRISQHGEQLGWYDKHARVTGIRRNQSGAVYRIVHAVLGEFLK
jgi:hypothetical protein